MPSTPVPQLDYAGRAAVAEARWNPPKAATVLGVIAMILGVGGTVTSWLGIESQRGNPFPFVAIFCVVLWAGSNAIALILGGIGWGISRRFGWNRGYICCVIANTLNWAGLAALGLLFLLD